MIGRATRMLKCSGCHAIGSSCAAGDEAEVRSGHRTIVSRLSGWFCPHALSEAACQTTSADMPKPVAGAICEVEGGSKSIDGGVRRGCQTILQSGQTWERADPPVSTIA